jgi:hypothetical protein
MSSTQVRALMPGDLPPRHRGWTLGAAGLMMLMAYIAWWSIEASAVPNGYLARRGWQVDIDGPWRFPSDQVRTWLTAMVVEGALAIWVLSARWSLSLAVRSLGLALAAFLIFLLMVPLVMHSSAPFPQHLTWLVFAIGWLLVFAIGAAAATRLARYRVTPVTVDSLAACWKENSSDPSRQNRVEPRGDSAAHLGRR